MSHWENQTETAMSWTTSEARTGEETVLQRGGIMKAGRTLSLLTACTP